jgi:putative membrane-bound dehydrogenase-like protein
MPRSLLAALLLFAPHATADEPMPPEKSVARMKLPEGFLVRLVAGEPTLIKPIAMTTDDRGRLWVVESHSYPHWLTDKTEGKDRVLILDDPRGDGNYRCTVFWDKGANLSGIALGFGGVWLCATPNLLFVPVKPGEDKPAGPPEVVLDGWDLNAKHNVFNDLTWGPDGWLYGCNGILSNSLVGKPGAPKAERVALNCGVWRYHPTKKVFEEYASGTTNPWGLDFDDYGEMFITNCVIKHLFHVVPGARFVRMYGQDIHPNTYGLIESCADHIHWAGGNWTTSRGGEGAHGEAGGGHAHAGALVYLGDNWPAEYRNHIFMCNIHGNRVNQDILERHGSGYVAKHGKDFLMAHDAWFRGLCLTMAPDGGVFVADWHDTGECHNNDKTHPSGRIYKVTYGQPKRVAVDLAKLSDAELVKLQSHRNDWWVRHARRLLQERAAKGELSKEVAPRLLAMLTDEKDAPRKLRALWALHAIGAADLALLDRLLDGPDEAVRVWAVRLLVEDKARLSPKLPARLAAVARKEKAASVRLALASALQRIEPKLRWALAEALAAHAEDAADAYLPLMLWYGVEPLVAADPDRAAELLLKTKVPLVRQYIARRIAAMAE